ncbi:MAG: hypothetical protein ACXV8I_09525 [Methylobacter sp.]
MLAVLIRIVVRPIWKVDNIWALNGINKAVELSPKNKAKLYLGKAHALEGLNDPMVAMQTYKKACLLGLSTVCQKIGQSAIPANPLSEYLLNP